MATDSFVQVDSGRSKLGNYNLGIGDSWVKAITEIITNSHQNYHQYWNELGLDKKKENPMITIIADPHRETFTTVDNGTGITEDLAGIESLIDEILLETTGTPAAIASSSAFGCPSFTEGK